MVGREKFIEDLISQLREISTSIEERESTEEDFAIIRELADQLLDEVEVLQK